MKIKNYNLDDLLIGKDFFEDKKYRMYKYFAYIILLFLIFIFLFVYYFKIELKLKVIGIVENTNNISVIKSDISAKVVINNFNTGDKIRKNELILKLDDTKLLENYEILNNKLKENENFYNYLNGKKYNKDIIIENYNLIKNDILININIEEIKLKELKKEIDNYKKLYSLGGVSKNKIVTIENEYLILKNNKRILENKIENLRLSKLDEIRQNIDTLKLELNKIEKQKENYYIKSPIDGIIEKVKKINIDDVISSEIIANIIPENNKYEIKIFIDEKNINKININNKINYILKDNNEKEIYTYGKIKYISNIAQSINNSVYYYVIADIIINPNIKLKQGNTIETSIIYGEATIFNYILNYIK